MKITLHTVEEFDLSEAQIAMLRRLNKRSEYLHGEEDDLAMDTPGIRDINGEGRYALSEKGRRILAEIDKISNSV